MVQLFGSHNVTAPTISPLHQPPQQINQATFVVREKSLGEVVGNLLQKVACLGRDFLSIPGAYAETPDQQTGGCLGDKCTSVDHLKEDVQAIKSAKGERSVDYVKAVCNLYKYYVQSGMGLEAKEEFKRCVDLIDACDDEVKNRDLQLPASFYADFLLEKTGLRDREGALKIVKALKKDISALKVALVGLNSPSFYQWATNFFWETSFQNYYSSLELSLSYLKDPLNAALATSLFDSKFYLLGRAQFLASDPIPKTLLLGDKGEQEELLYLTRARLIQPTDERDYFVVKPYLVARMDKVFGFRSEPIVLENLGKRFEYELKNDKKAAIHNKIFAKHMETYCRFSSKHPVLNGKTANFLEKLAVVKRDEEDLEEAIGFYERAVRAWEEWPPVEAPDPQSLGNGQWLEQAIAHATQASEKNMGLFMGLTTLGTLYAELGNYDKSIKSLYKCQENLKKEDKEGLAFGYILSDLILSSILPWNEKYELAIDHHTKAIELAKKNPDTNGNEQEDSLASIYHSWGKLEEALNHYQMALSNQRMKPGDQRANVALLLSKLGSVYHSLGQYELAIEYQLKALDNREQLGQKVNMDVACIHHLLGISYSHLGKVEQAERHEAKSKESGQKIIGGYRVTAEEKSLLEKGGQFELSFYSAFYSYLSGIYHIKEGNYKKAVLRLNRALKLQQKFLGGESLDVARTHHLLSLAYDQLNNARKANLHSTKAQSIAEQLGRPVAEMMKGWI